MVVVVVYERWKHVQLAFQRKGSHVKKTKTIKLYIYIYLKQTCDKRKKKQMCKGDELQVQKVDMVGNLEEGGHGKESRERWWPWR